MDFLKKKLENENFFIVVIGKIEEIAIIYIGGTY